MECISVPFARKLGLEIRKFPQPWRVALANDTVDTIDSWAMVEVTIGGIMCGMMAMVYGSGACCDFVLSQTWLLRVRAIQDWGERNITLHGKEGTVKKIPFYMKEKSKDLAMLAPGQQESFKTEVERGEVVEGSMAGDNEEVSEVEAEEASREVMEILEGLENIIVLYAHLERMGLVKRAGDMSTTVQLSNQGKVKA